MSFLYLSEAEHDNLLTKAVIEKSQVDRSPADRTVTPHTPDQRHGLPQGNLTVSGHRGPETPALGVSSTARQLTRGGTPNTTQRWLEQRGATIGVTFTVSLGSMEPAAAPQNMTEPVADDGTHDEEPVRKKNKIIS